MDPEASSSGEGADGEGPTAAVRRAPIAVIVCSFHEVEGSHASSLRARHVDGVERIAAAAKAADPVLWEWDQAWLSFAKAPIAQQVTVAWRTAVELWQRSALDLDLPARIVLLFGPVDADGSPVVEGVAAEEVTALAALGPERAIVVSEDIALCLRAEARDTLALAGALPDASSAYVFPADAVRLEPRPVSEQLLYWSNFAREALSPAIREVKYVGFRLPRRPPPVLDLLDVFVSPALTVREDRVERSLPGPDASLFVPEGVRDPVDSQGNPIEPVLEQHRHLVVLGEPGAGKTTLLKWLAVKAAEGAWAELTGEVGPRLPLLLSVGRLAETLAHGDAPRPMVLARYFGFDGETAADVARFLDRQLERGRCVVLLDGLDEVRVGDRAAVEQWLQEFAAHYASNWYVATSRFVGYSGLRLPADAAVAQIASFDARAREAFVRAFCRAYVKWETGEDRPVEAEAQATALLQAIDASDRLSGLAQNPFMLSALALIHRAEGRLPRHRVQAYQMFLRTICETWGQARKLVPRSNAALADTTTVAYEEEAIPVLGDLALAMHEQHPTGVAPTDFVRETIAAALRAREDIDEPAALAAADAFLKRAGAEVQILLERGAGQWGFLHLTFQEFFVAAGLHASERFEEVALAHLLEPRWEEIIRLGVGYLALVQTRPVAAQKFLERVLTYEAPEPWSRAAEILGKHIGLAAVLAVEAGETLPPKMQRRIAEEFVRWYCEGVPRDVDESAPGDQSQVRLSHWIRQIGLSEFAKPLKDALIARLITGDSRGKARAASALEQLQAILDVAVIVEALRGDPVVSQWAVGYLLVRSASLQELLALVTHEDERVRCAVVRSAAQRSAVERASILKAVQGDPSVTVRLASLWSQEALATEWGQTRFLRKLSRKETDRLTPFLDDPSVQVRLSALGRLSNSDDTAVQAAQEKLLRTDPSPGVRRAAAHNLLTSGALSVFHTALAELAGQISERWPYFSAAAMIRREDIGDRIDYLFGALESADFKLRAMAARILGELARSAQPNTLPRQVEFDVAFAARVEDTDPLVRRETLLGLDVRGDLAFEAALRATHDPDPEVRFGAYEAVCRRGLIDPVIAAFRRGLDDSNPRIRALSLNVLGAQLFPQEERTKLVEAAAADPSAKVRSAAAQWLPLCEDAIDRLLRRLLADPADEVRAAAIQGVSHLQSTAIIEAIAPLLNDSNRGIVWSAAQALTYAGEEGMCVLLEHADKPEARAALWQWAEARGWVFTP